PSPPIARSSRPLRPADTNATTAPDRVGTSASSLKRISVRFPSSRDAYSYSSLISSSSSDTEASFERRLAQLSRLVNAPRRMASDFDQKCVALAATRADRGKAEPVTVAAQVVHHRAVDPD